MSDDPSSDDSRDIRLQQAATQGLTPSIVLGSSKQSAAWQPPDPGELQKEIPQYKVLDLLGRGGMGAVYKGWQVSLERYIAIKVLPPGMDDGDAQFAARFKQEAKTMAKFMHPGIVGVFDAGKTTSGLLYIVMEFVEGTDVAQMVKSQGRLAADHALAITAHVCDALQYAHSRGVIHRDIKPANIMVNTEGQVKVADFGLAKATGAAGHGLTRTDMSMGTPDFIAPEALTLGVIADHRADLYAVGVMLYNMLTGEIPRGKFKMPSQKAGTDPRFDTIIDKAMEQEREQRYQNAQEIRRDLDVILTAPMEKSGPPAEAVPLQESGIPGAPGSLRGSASRPAASGKPPQRGGTPSLPRKKSGAGLFIGLGAAALIAISAFIAFHEPSGGFTNIPESATPPATVAGLTGQPPPATSATMDKLAVGVWMVQGNEGSQHFLYANQTCLRHVAAGREVTGTWRWNDEKTRTLRVTFLNEHEWEMVVAEDGKTAAVRNLTTHQKFTWLRSE